MTNTIMYSYEFSKLNGFFNQHKILCNDIRETLLENQRRKRGLPKAITMSVKMLHG